MSNKTLRNQAIYLLVRGGFPVTWIAQQFDTSRQNVYKIYNSATAKIQLWNKAPAKKGKKI